MGRGSKKPDGAALDCSPLTPMDIERGRPGGVWEGSGAGWSGCGPFELSVDFRCLKLCCFVRRCCGRSSGLVMPS